MLGTCRRSPKGIREGDRLGAVLRSRAAPYCWVSRCVGIATRAPGRSGVRKRRSISCATCHNRRRPGWDARLSANAYATACRALRLSLQRQNVKSQVGEKIIAAQWDERTQPERGPRNQWRAAGIGRGRSRRSPISAILHMCWQWPQLYSMKERPDTMTRPRQTYPAT